MTPTPRNELLRLALAATYGLLFVGPAFLVQNELSTGRYFGGNRLVIGSVELIPWLTLSALLILVLPRVGYRRRDALLGLAPFYGFVFTLKICWRLASLPYQDWPSRPEHSAPLVPSSQRS